MRALRSRHKIREIILQKNIFAKTGMNLEGNYYFVDSDGKVSKESTASLDGNATPTCF
jgi:hypothetical protein